MRFNFRLFFRLLYWSVFKSKDTHGRLTPHRRKALIGWFLIIPTLNLFTWFSFLLDEIFFRNYRKQEVKAPIFIIGNFRSGSTLLQRLMAKDEEHFTAMRTWEIYGAPSITQRKMLKLISRLDNRYFGGRLHRKLYQIEGSRLNSIPMHRVAIHEVDEDEGILLHNWTSSFLIFIFPFMDALPPYLNFDAQNSKKDKKMSMEFYYRMVQKHVYFHGGKQYIAKNPAFSSKIHALREYFPDAKFIYLVRNPVDMLASKTSFFTYIWRYFNDPLEPYPFKDMLLDLTRRWYLETLKTLENLPESEYLIIKYNSLVEELDATTHKIFDHFDIPITPIFEKTLQQAVTDAAGYISKHKYSLFDMGYTAEQVYDQYREIFERFEFDLNGKALMAKVSKKYAEID
jgi:hypothetical protein